ncbi:MAG: hypothetical protein AVDCRST_MAG54-1237, partial [uncultured Actinomycetospora sp.]
GHAHPDLPDLDRDHRVRAALRRCDLPARRGVGGRRRDRARLPGLRRHAPGRLEGARRRRPHGARLPAAQGVGLRRRRLRPQRRHRLPPRLREPGVPRGGAGGPARRGRAVLGHPPGLAAPGRAGGAGGRARPRDGV